MELRFSTWIWLWLTFLGTIAYGAETAEELAKRLQPFLDQAERHDFIASDGVRLNYTIFHPTSSGAATQPIVLVPGRGESMFSYVEIAKRLAEKGYGPIYMIDHRGQGFSERLLRNTPNLNHTVDFNSYVQDLIRFMDTTIKPDLAKRGIASKPFFIAHSMGGAIANLAIDARPDLVDRIAYIAPMFGINAGNKILNIGENSVAHVVAQTLCWANCGTLNLGGSAAAAKGAKANTSSKIRQAYAAALEDAHDIRNYGTSASWLKQAIEATRRVQARAAQQGTQSVIFQGSQDNLVRNEVHSKYVCEAQNCSLVELRGGHSLHKENPNTQEILVDDIDHFFRTGALPDRSSSCPLYYRLLFRAKPS